MRLLIVEFRRLFARRFFWIGGVALLLGLGFVLGITAAQSEIPDAADRARAEQQAAEQAPRTRLDRERCEEAERKRQAGESVDPAIDQQFPAGFDCDQIVEPRPEAFLVDNPFRFTAEMEDRTQVLTVVLALFAFLVGATAVGAEWHHGTLGALLLWEPRRIRVYMAKLLALFGGVTVLAVLGYAANVAGHWAVAELRGLVGDVSLDFQRELALTTARGFAVALAAAAAGFALAFMLRRTAAALGVLIGYFGIAEVGARAFFSSDADPYLLTSYTAAWLADGIKLFNYDCGPAGFCGEQTIELTLWHGALYVGGLALFLVLLSAVVFRRREVA